MEFSTVEGQFCGRSRTWLQDGTLVSGEVNLFNRRVTLDQYRRAAATDARLPKLRGRIGKPPVKNSALEQHTYRVFVGWLLKNRNRVEARDWLQADDKKSASLAGSKAPARRRNLLQNFISQARSR